MKGPYETLDKPLASGNVGNIKIRIEENIKYIIMVL